KPNQAKGLNVDIRYSTTAFPAWSADGLSIPGSPFSDTTATHAGLSKNTIYYYSLFSFNSASDVCPTAIQKKIQIRPGSWTQKANFPGPARIGAVGFSIGNKGYVGLGWHYSGSSPAHFL